MKFKLRLIVATIGYLLAAPQILKSQNFQYTNRIEEVSFSGVSKVSNYISIRKDDNSAYFLAPHWTSSEKKPVAYVSGSYPNVGAKFRFSCKPQTDVWVHGKNRDGFNFKAQKLSFSSTDPTLGIYDFALADVPFPPKTVNYYPNFTIQWFVSNSEVGPNWKDMGVSENPLYVTLKEGIRLPELSGSNESFYSLIHWGCSNANGMSASATTDEPNIVNALYGEFTDTKVVRVGTTLPMYYWGPSTAPPAAGCFTTAGLLLLGDGRCGAWAKLFIDLLRTQGISGSELVLVTWTLDRYSGGDIPVLDTGSYFDFLDDAITSGLSIVPSSLKEAIFFVKKWKIVGRTFTDSYYNPLTPRLFDDPLAINDETGLDAQGSHNPWSRFSDHAIVRYNGKLYDPSYGSSISSSLSDWEAKSIDGFGTLVSTLISGGGVKDKFWFKKDNADTITDMLSLTVVPY
jgi:hypothetical protein